MARSILLADITLARRTDRIAIASPGDFRHGTWTRSAAIPAGALPYCVDVISRRSVYLTGLEPRAAQEAPFYYLYARRNGRAIASVPWEWGEQSERGAPILLFSPGRCGSTLLSQILFDGGIPNVSEPDFYTQLTSIPGASGLNPFRSAMQASVRRMGADMSGAFGQPLVVKLRAESCRAPQLIADASEKRTMFMTRRFEDWVRSTGRVFRNPPNKMIGKYMQSLACYAWLKKHTSVRLIRYEDLVASPEQIAENLSRFLGRTIPAGIATAALARDSQEGTPLAQGVRATNDRTDRFVDDALALWNSDKVRRARDRLGVAEIAP
ncbi:MAG TPA: hypothetical protein VGU69_02010 [Rhizomicrobium sp.]|nr:hypothetical protein [Rhizomicrobium sp.]